MGNGSSKVADQAIAKANFPDKDSEQVLVQSRTGLRADDPAFKAAVADVAARLGRTAHVTEIESPYAKGNQGQISKDGRSALVSFSIPGDTDVAKERVGATLATTAAAQRAHPQLRIEQFGGASAPTRRSRSPSTTTSRRPRRCRCRSRC